jgi:hypothetical protein
LSRTAPKTQPDTPDRHPLREMPNLAHDLAERKISVRSPADPPAINTADESTLICNIPHLLRLLREYEAFYNGHRPHRALGQAAPLRPLPKNAIDLETFRIRRRDRAGGILHEYQHAA